MRLYKASEWETSFGEWHVADTSDLGNMSAAWWIPAHIFGISQEEYIHLLVEKYHVDKLSYNLEKNILLFSWKNYQYAHKYLLDINRIAKKKNFCIKLDKI